MTPQTSPSSPPLPVRAWLARTFHGLSWKRLGIFLAIVALPTAGHVISRSFMPDKTLAVTAMVAPMFFTHLTVFFGAVWIVVVVASNWAPARTGPRVLALAAAVLVGLILGNLANNIIDPLLFPPMKDPSTLLKEISAVMLWSHVIVAGVLGYYFLLREEEVAASLHREQMRRIDLDRELAEARLQLMQAQIEPHFLFNALANVRRLYQTDAPSARAMLDQLSRYLGAMLPRMRSTESTLGQELALALAYLHVQKIRMGARLTVVSAVPESLQSLPFPPMMLVTLVENAIRHGVSPRPLPHSDHHGAIADRLDVAALDRAPAPALLDAAEPDVGAAIGGEHRMKAVDRLHDRRLRLPCRLRHRVDRRAVIDPAGRIALEQEVR
jgi:hypothetical protein